MSDLNKCMFTGRIGQEPDLKFMPNGSAILNLSIAVGSQWKDKSTGEKQEHTEWVRVVFFQRAAEVIYEYCGKGSKLFIEGEFKTRKWEKDGVDHYATEIRGTSFQFLDTKPPGSSQPQRDTPQPRQAPQQQQGRGQSQQVGRTVPQTYEDRLHDTFDDDIPF